MSEYPSPSVTGFTVYSKKDCRSCSMVKELLSSFEQDVNYIQCDDYLVNKELFMAFIEFKGAKRQFPMVFFDGIYIGGFAETLKLCKTK